MEIKKNIHLFRWENDSKIQSNILTWKMKFIEKHGELNLVEIDNNNISEGILSDCLTAGFLWWTRMIILREKLLKSEKEKKNENEWNIDWWNILWKEDSEWIDMLQKVPDSNFIVFIWNKKSLTELEKWLEKNATVHNFAKNLFEENISTIQSELNMSYELYEYLVNKLNNNDRLIQLEIKKIKWVGIVWDKSKIDKYIPDYREENAFELINMLWNNDKKNVINIWKNLIETSEIEKSIATILTMIRKMFIAGNFQNIKNLPITPWQYYNWKKMSYKKEVIFNFYERLIKVDIAEKTGNLPKKADAFLMELLSLSL